MQIGIVIYGYPPEKLGGAELQAKLLAQKLAQNSHRVTVFAGSKKNEVIQESDLMKVIKIKYADKWLLRLFVSQLIAFLPVIKKETDNLDILLCYQVNPPGIVGLVSKMLFRIPLVTCVRADSEYKNFLRKYFITPLLLKFSDQFLVQTLKIKRDLQNISFFKFIFSSDRLEKIKVISNGLEILAQDINSQPRQNVIFVGRLHKVKGIEYLLKAMQKVDASLTIIGKGEDEERLKDLAQGLDVDFLGELPHHEVLKQLLGGRVLVLPSLGEALPNVILEAMSTGLPVVASNVGGIADIIIHGETGYLVEPGDVDQIERWINLLLQDDEVWQNISRNCLEQVKKYDWAHVVRSYEDTFKAVLS